MAGTVGTSVSVTGNVPRVVQTSGRIVSAHTVSEIMDVQPMYTGMAATGVDWPR